MKHFIILLVVLSSFSVQAQNKNSKVEIQVDGVCNSCKSRIEKASMQIKGVKMAKWDVRTHMLFIILDQRKNLPSAVQEAIAKSGHDNKLPDQNTAVIAPDKAYESIPKCCKYRDPDVAHHHH